MVTAAAVIVGVTFCACGVIGYAALLIAWENYVTALDNFFSHVTNK
jgi:hypothetical protein